MGHVSCLIQELNNVNNLLPQAQVYRNPHRRMPTDKLSIKIFINDRIIMDFQKQG